MTKKSIYIPIILGIASTFAYANSHKYVAVIQEDFNESNSGGIEPPLPDPDPKMKIKKSTSFISELSCENYNGSYPGGVTFKKITDTNKRYADDFCLTDKHSSYLHRECYEVNGQSHVRDWFCDDTTDSTSSPFPGSQPSEGVWPQPDPWPDNPNGKEANGFHDK